MSVLKISAAVAVLFLLMNPFAYSQDCNITSKANDILPDRLCAPVNLSWEVTYRGVNDGGTLVEIIFDWNDGNPVQVVAAINTNPNPAIREWKATVTHTYPQGGNRCNYRPTATLRVNGVLCTSSIQQQNVTVWDTDNFNGGQVAINPQVFYICVGNDGTVVFNDVTLFNCVPPVENDVPNTPTRWTQWVYGTSYTINGILVNGAPQTYPFYDAVYAHPGPVTGPTPPNLSTLPIYCPNTALIWQFFEVTLRYWNVCNPYDDPLIPGPPADPLNGDYPPVIATAQILIVPYPDATIQPAGPFCSNDPAVNLTAATPGGTWSGTGITNASTGRFSPSTAGPGLHTITYTVTNAYGCTGTDDIQIRVWARPTINMLPGTNLQVCPGNNLFLDGNPSPGDGAITNHLWMGNTAPLSANNIQNPVFNTTTPGTYSLTYTVTDANGCTRSQNVTVAVTPVSANITPDPGLACASVNFQLNGNPSGGTGTYPTHVWTGDIAYLNSTTIQNPVFNCATPGTYNLTYTVFDNNGCTGTDNITVSVSDVPIANAGVDDTTCGLTIALNAIPSIGTGSWSLQSGPGTAVFSPPNQPVSSVTVSQYGAYQILWTESFGPSCTSGDMVEMVFIQMPTPNAGTDINLCGLSYTLQAMPSVGTGQWIQAAGPSAATISSPGTPVSPVSATVYGLYSFVWHEDNGYTCISSDTVNVAFDVVPVPQFAPSDTSGCPPFYLPFNNLSQSAATYLWNFGNGQTSSLENPSMTFTNTTPADITYTVWMKAWSTYGCTDSISHSVTVHPNPTANFFSNAIPGCSPVSVQFTNTSTGYVASQWDFGDGSPVSNFTNPLHPFVNNGNLIQYYNVNLIVTNSHGCPDTSTGYITVFPDPDYIINVSPDSSCHPVTATISTQPGAQQYYWDFGDGFAQTGTHIIQHFYTNTGPNPVTYTITLIATSALGCVDTSQTQITVMPSPMASFNMSQTAGCSPLNISIANASSGAASCSWTFGDGTTSGSCDAVIPHTYFNTQAASVQYTCWLHVENSYGCLDSMQQQVTVFPNPDYTITVSPDSNCRPVHALLTTQPGAQSYLWQYGDMISETGNHITQHTYTNNGSTPLTYTITLIATSAQGCQDTSHATITVLPAPNIQMTLNPSVGCTPFNASFNNSSTGAGQFMWRFGDGDVSYSANSVVGHEYINNQAVPVTFEAWLIGQNTYGCRDSVSRTVTVNPAVTALFNGDSTGCSPLTLSFTNQSFGASTWHWSFGDGTFSAQQNPQHTFVNPGTLQATYNVTLTATSLYGCSGSFTRNVTVFPTPQAAFTATPSTLTFPAATVTITNMTSSGGWTYHWDFGDNSTSTSVQPGTHTYASWGAYTIALIVTNPYCSDTATTIINIVAPPPVSQFTLDAQSGCAPLTVQFTNSSLYADTYTWDFGDGTSASAPNPTHTYYNAGDFIVKLWANGPGGQQIATGGPVHVFPQPTAYFSVSPTVVFIPDQPVLCFNMSQEATTYQWSFGDGTGSNEQNPVHYYQQEGEYTISLFVSTQYHCTDSFSIPRAVVAKAAGQIEFPSAFSPNPFGPSGGEYNPADLNNDIFHPVHVGIDEYQFSIYNRWGELIFESKDVNVGWDGYYRNQICKQDVYVWKVKGKFINGASFMKAGDVTLIR